MLPLRWRRWPRAPATPLKAITTEVRSRPPTTVPSKSCLARAAAQGHHDRGHDREGQGRPPRPPRGAVVRSLTLAADNFERAVFPNAMIVGDCVITHLLGKLGYLESGKVKVMVVDTFHLFDNLTMPFLADREEVQVQGRDLWTGRLREQGCLPQEVR